MQHNLDALNFRGLWPPAAKSLTLVSHAFHWQTDNIATRKRLRVASGKEGQQPQLKNNSIYK